MFFSELNCGKKFRIVSRFESRSNQYLKIEPAHIVACIGFGKSLKVKKNAVVLEGNQPEKTPGRLVFVKGTMVVAED